MKASNSQQKTAGPPPTTVFQPKPLSLEQENAIDLLLLGQSDREVAEAVGVHRMTVQTWRTQSPLFMATLASKRESLFAGAADRLRSLLGKALDILTASLDAGDVPSALAVLKATGLHGYCPPTGEMDVQKIVDKQVWEALAREKIPGDLIDMADRLDNPRRRQRRAEIEAELRAAYGENGDG